MINKNDSLEKEKGISELKNRNSKNNINFNLISEIKNAFSDICIDNSFALFQSINDIILIVYSTKNISIIGFNLNDYKEIIEIKKSHKEHISNIRHYLDSNNKKDIILSLSYKDNNIKLWDAGRWECILNLTNVNSEGYIFSACILKDNNQQYVLTSNYNWENFFEPIKIFDFSGNQLKTINNSEEKVFYIL